MTMRWGPLDISKERQPAQELREYSIGGGGPTSATTTTLPASRRS